MSTETKARERREEEKTGFPFVIKYRFESIFVSVPFFLVKRVRSLVWKQLRLAVLILYHHSKENGNPCSLILACVEFEEEQKKKKEEKRAAW